MWINLHIENICKYLRIISLLLHPYGWPFLIVTILATPWALLTWPLCLNQTALHPFLSKNRTNQLIEEEDPQIGFTRFHILSFLGYFWLGWNFVQAQPNSNDKMDGDQEHGHLIKWKCYRRLTCLDSAFPRRIHFCPKLPFQSELFRCNRLCVLINVG